MPQKTNISVPPYSDDFSIDNNFYKVLFRPGYAIQARELNTIQSILQNQIENHGKFQFKHGDLVVPGEVNLITRLNYVKLSSVSEVAVNENNVITYKKYDIKLLVGQKLEGINSGVVAIVEEALYGSETESDVLYVTYITSGNSANEKCFRQGETLSVVDGINTPLLVVGTDGSVSPTSIEVIDPDTQSIKFLDSPALGFGTGVKVESGVYFVNGTFVNNEEQLIIVDKYYDKPSAKIGFNVEESIITPDEDNTLYDNSRGFSNFASPGAHRLKIDLNLVSLPYNSLTGSNFIQLISIKNGEIQKLIKPTQYSLLEDTLARRTYDESGDYVVNPFSIDIREYYQKDGNFGVYAKGEDNLVNGISETDAESSLLASISPGKAYVKGYEILNNETKYLKLDKARDTITSDNNTLKSTGGTTFTISNVYGSIPLNSEGSDLTAYPTVFLHNVFSDGSNGSNSINNETSYKATTNRRGNSFSIDDGIKTVYVYVTNTTTPIGYFNQLNYFDKLNELYLTISRQGGIPTAVSKLKVIAVSKVTRQEYSPEIQLLELTVIGKKNILDEYLKEYDLEASGKIRELFFTEADALANTNKLGNVIDYNESITPIVGLAKANDFSVAQIGPGFNENTDIVISKGRTTSRKDGVITLRILNAGTGYSDSTTDLSPGYQTTTTSTIGSGLKIKVKTFSGNITDITITDPGTNYKEGEIITIPGGANNSTAVVTQISSAIYNTAFNLSYFNPVFFTRLILTEKKPDDSTKFAVGQYIFGGKSGAYGVIEGTNTTSYSSGNKLFIRLLYGSFLPGETIFDESGNSLKIAEENTLSHFVVVNRGTGYTSPQIVVDGVKYDSSQIKLENDGGSIYAARIVNAEVKNKQYIQPPVVNATTTGTVGAECKITAILNKNTVLTYSPEDVKSFYSQYGSGNSYKFTADVEVEKNEYRNLSQVTNFTFSGAIGQKYLECDSFVGDASINLIQGDLIIFTDSNSVAVKAIVQYATAPEGTKKSRIYLDNALKINVVNSSITRIRPKISNASAGSLIYPTGSTGLKTLSKTSDDSNFKYYIRKDFVTTGSSNGNFITFSAQLDYGTQRFATFNNDTFLVTVLNGGSSPLVSTGDILYIDSKYVQQQSATSSTSGITTGSITLNLPNGFFGNISSNFPKLKLTATVEITKGKPKLKTAIKNKRVIVKTSGDKIIPIRGQDYDSEDIQTLSYSDVYKLHYVYEGSATTPPIVDLTGKLISGTDLTEYFTFDDGQRDTVYDVSRLVLKSGYNPPTGQLIIGFDYFDHSQGDYCTVDSYLHESGVEELEIPSFNSSVHGNVYLRDVIDFRPKVDSTSIISGFQNQTFLGSINYISFSGEGGSFSPTPASDKNIEYTFSYSKAQYLDRIDSIFLNKSGNFILKKGSSSLNPVTPDSIEDSIRICNIHVPAFTYSNKDVKVIPVDNRRYTMSDIGKLEKRVERLEYYTTLSILEQQALNTQIKDQFGFERFKSGFVVDNFETHYIGDISSDDYKCSIDTQQAVLRPQVSENCFNLVELFKRDDQRQNLNYQLSNDVVTLPYTNKVFVENKYASKTINPNNFTAVQSVGDLILNPTVDMWYNKDVAPLVTNNNTKLFSIFLSTKDIKDKFSSFYNSFLVSWIGVNRLFYNINSLSNINSQQISSTVQIASTNTSSNISPQNNETAKGVETTTNNNNSVISSLQYFIRSVPVKFAITRLKPLTKVYVFMDGKDISRWVIPDSNFTGIAGNSLSSFGADLITNQNGNLSGLIVMPAGKPPEKGSQWTGNVQFINYDDSANEEYFTTGIKTIIFTSSNLNADKNIVDTYAETKYYSIGNLPENPASITSTIPAYFKANEGIQIVDSKYQNKEKPNPLCQTFKVQNYEGGVFVTGIDLYFAKKSNTIPIRVYLTNVDLNKPGKYIVPGSESVLNPNTYLKVTVNQTCKVKVNELVEGSSSGIKGNLAQVLDKNNVVLTPDTQNLISLSNDQVYTFVLDSISGNVTEKGISYSENEQLKTDYLTNFNVANNKNCTITIAKKSGKIIDLRILNCGANYNSALISIESPQLPGGSTATGSVKVSNGKVYYTELSTFGNGYTEPPSVIIKGVGSGSGGAVIESVIDYDTPSVIMGVSVDETSASIPTRFNFDYPVYLQNETEYSLAIETDSNEYSIWASTLANESTDGQSIVSNPSLGAVYKSQNTDAWTEDLLEDIKFTLYRAEFDITKSSTLYLTNQDLGFEKLKSNPVETYSLSNSDATSQLFKNNNSIVKIHHRDNGFEDTEKSYVFFKNIETVGGFSSTVMNSTLFEVFNVGLDSYNITGPTRANANSFGGGTFVFASHNKKYEKLYADVNYIQPPNTEVDSYIKTTNVIPVDSKTSNYLSYSQDSDYNKTFLNKQQFFNNQKVLCSRINEVLNDIDQSLVYKFNLNSSKSHLSPLIDLRVSSVKLSTNRVENTTGYENRYGRRNQIINLYPVYSIKITGNSSTAVTLNQNVQGVITGARGRVVAYTANPNTIRVKVTSTSTFIENERLIFSNQSALNNVSILPDGIVKNTFTFTPGSYVVAFNPSDLTKKYDNKIDGKIEYWDDKNQQLIISSNKQPINDNYTSPAVIGSSYARNSDVSIQTADILRVGDLLYYDGIVTGTEALAEISSVAYTTGVDYSSDVSSKNSSNLSKYTTKQITINSAGTAIDVRLTANIKNISNIKVLYRYKTISSQLNFDDIEWKYFNADGSPNELVYISPLNALSGDFESQEAYQEFKYSVSNLEQFTSFAIKIVMNSDDPVYVPKIQDIRAIASY